MIRLSQFLVLEPFLNTNFFKLIFKLILLNTDLKIAKSSTREIDTCRFVKFNTGEKSVLKKIANCEI